MNNAPTRRAHARLLEVRTVDVVSGWGGSLALVSVRCPVHGRSSPVEECAECASAGVIAQDALTRGAYLACGAPPVEPRGAVRPGDTPVACVMRRTCVVVRTGVARDVAADALRARGVSSAPVVDGDGRPVGVVAEADLLRAPRGATVAEAMQRAAPSVADGAPLSRALALMSAQRVDALAVVAQDGAVVGVLSAGDVVAWLAAELG